MSEYPTPSVGNPALGLASVSGVPSEGTGLQGSGYFRGDARLGSVTSLKALIFDAGEPDYTFTASQLAYGGASSSTTVAEFLGHDADSVSGSEDLEVGPGGMSLTGYIYIPRGEHTINVRSDDGYELKIGGELFSEHEFGRGQGDTYATSFFEGGLYEIDLLYFESGGAGLLRLEIDGFVVDASAFYASVDDFQNPPADVELIAPADYHPSQTLGTEVLGEGGRKDGTNGVDVIDGSGFSDTIVGLDGDDILNGGYGNDRVRGGNGDDVLDGGRGSDYLKGGDGDDLLVSRSDAGEQRIGQLAIGKQTRPDPDNEVNDARQKLKGWEEQTLVSDDVLEGGAGRDTFLFTQQINAKLEIIKKHTRHDGTINWAGVAGENDELHDHWVDSFGIDIIADYNAAEDTIAVIGHTANIELSYQDTDGDGDEESIITVISKQHGNGGAHDRDLLGQIIVHGDRVEADDITTDANVTHGIVEDIKDGYEAIKPDGETKVTNINGQTVFGYDTRGPGEGNNGAIVSNPADYVDNPFLNAVSFADPSGEAEVELTREPFDQLETVEVEGETKLGTAGDDTLSQSAPATPGGLPGALAYWDISRQSDGAFEDAKGGSALKTYTLWENQAQLRTDNWGRGPSGENKSAITFDGKSQFAYIEHDKAYQVTQGTISIWVRPFDLSDDSIFLSKDERGSGDGGHFRLGHNDDGGLILRFAPGDGGGNTTWETNNAVFTEDQWSNVTVNFTADGVAVFVDGEKIPNGAWTAKEGNLAHPGLQKKAYLLQNDNPWVLGADTAATQVSDTAAQFGTDDDKLANAFEGQISDFGLWGGFTADDALTQAQINELITDGPGAALTNPAGVQPMIVSDDVLRGHGGNDTLMGEAGDDKLGGGYGDDTLEGGYGDDKLIGGRGNDVLDGGFGSDMLKGGMGDDLLISRSDVGEDRLGQLVLDDPSREFPDPSISDEYLKLVDWTDQAIVGDDLLIGGAGADHFYFELGINAKLDILQKHVNDDRTIDWMGVAGENRRLHDHWVDGFGIDIIADYNASEDKISIIGHTTNILDVSYFGYDTDGDGVNDDVYSVITAYSQQGGGGAHDEDLLGYVVVYGDLVDEDDINTDAGVHYGVVDTIDQAQIAQAPNGETRTVTDDDGTVVFGYDSRDIEGNPLANRTDEFSLNKFVENHRDKFGSVMPDGLDLAGVVMTHDGGRFNGVNQSTEIAHTAGLAQRDGTIALSFVADAPGEGKQGLLSKDHTGYKGGGHMDLYINSGGRLQLRYQSFEETKYLTFNEKIEAGVEYNVAFTFDAGEINLFVNGELVDSDEGFADGMIGNLEDLVVGASTAMRNGDEDRLQDFFDGTVSNVVVLDRPLHAAEAIILAEAGGDLAALANSVDIDGTGQRTSNGEPPVAADRPEVADAVMGTAEGETLKGFAGDDTLDGGAGADILFGGMGSDTLTGGAGEDGFAWRKAAHGGDEITDFTSGQDKLMFKQSAFALSADIAGQIALGGAAEDADDRLIYDQAEGKLYFDRDGTGDDEAVLIADLGAGTALTQDDFALL